MSPRQQRSQKDPNKAEQPLYILHFLHVLVESHIPDPCSDTNHFGTVRQKQQVGGHILCKLQL